MYIGTKKREADLLFCFIGLSAFLQYSSSHILSACLPSFLALARSLANHLRLLNNFTSHYFFVLFILNIHDIFLDIVFLFSYRFEEIETRPERVRGRKQRRGTRFTTYRSSSSRHLALLHGGPNFILFFLNIVSLFLSQSYVLQYYCEFVFGVRRTHLVTY